MRSGCRLGNVAAGAVALEKAAVGAQAADGVVVMGLPLTLTRDPAVPGKPDGGELTELDGLHAGTDPVKVLHPQQEAPAGRTGKQPGQDRGPEVSHMQFAGGTRRKAARSHCSSRHGFQGT